MFMFILKVNVHVNHAGMLILSPMMVAPVCHVRDPINLTCTTSVEFISWSIMLDNTHGRDQEITAFINSKDLSQQPIRRVVNSTTFNFMRISAQGESPLISTLSIDLVSIDLNGTVVNCMNVANSMISASTAIYVIDTTTNYSDIHSLIILIRLDPTLHITSEECGTDDITVTVEWVQQACSVYNVSVSPLAPIVHYGRNTSCQLTIPYNIGHIFSVEAVAPCRPNTTAFIRLKYG